MMPYNFTTANININTENKEKNFKLKKYLGGQKVLLQSQTLNFFTST